MSGVVLDVSEEAVGRGQSGVLGHHLCIYRAGRQALQQFRPLCRVRFAMFYRQMPA